MKFQRTSRRLSRRAFLTTSTLGTAGVLAAPAIGRGLWAAPGPNGRIQVAQIGCGRMGTGDMKGVMAHRLARVVAVCDLDSKRRESARAAVASHYREQGEANVEVGAYSDYRDVLARPDIDAVIVSTPDHWHGLVAIEAALRGKSLYVQKPLTYDIAEAIALRKAVRARKVILQAGCQQRSEKPWDSFRRASEAVRNGRIGKVHTVRVGIGLDQPSGKVPSAMPVPSNLDYERWLGAAPEQPYMEGRVHPQSGYGRPGWITTEDFGLGMITNWGTHHVDIGLWALGMELSGPTSVVARADFMKNDVWTVHHTYHVELGFAAGITMILDNTFENGLRFEGSEGWVFCSRDATRVTASDGNAKDPAAELPPLRASDPKILGPLPAGALRWAPSPDHYLNWLEAVAAGRDPIAPVEHAVRCIEACCVSWIGMKLGRKLTWDPTAEAFVGDDEANALRARRSRKGYEIGPLLSQAGLTA
jgi:myo-inositol 2-dehydrogenase / D-chiro-inositol 1-dehydrogenase